MTFDHIGNEWTVICTYTHLSNLLGQLNPRIKYYDLEISRNIFGYFSDYDINPVKEALRNVYNQENKDLLIIDNDFSYKRLNTALSRYIPDLYRKKVIGLPISKEMRNIKPYDYEFIKSLYEDSFSKSISNFIN